MKKTEPNKVCPATKILTLVGERHVLAIIYNLISGPTGFNDLQDRMEINTATLSKRLDQLEKEGFIERLSCPTDSRRHYYKLTKRGQGLSKLIGQFSKI